MQEGELCLSCLEHKTMGSGSLANARSRVPVYWMTQGRWALANNAGRGALALWITMQKGRLWLSEASWTPSCQPDATQSCPGGGDGSQSLYRAQLASQRKPKPCQPGPEVSQPEAAQSPCGLQHSSQSLLAALLDQSWPDRSYLDLSLTTAQHPEPT